MPYEEIFGIWRISFRMPDLSRKFNLSLFVKLWKSMAMLFAGDIASPEVRNIDRMGAGNLN